MKRTLTSLAVFSVFAAAALLATLTWSQQGVSYDRGAAGGAVAAAGGGGGGIRKLRARLANVAGGAASGLFTAVTVNRRAVEVEKEKIGDSADTDSKDGIGYDFEDPNAAFVMYKDKKLYYPPGYEEVQLLGHGGQGTVFKATKVKKFWYKHHYYVGEPSWQEAEIRTSVLLKRNIMGAGPQAELGGRMNHDNIVRQYDAFAWHDDIWTETEWIAGRSLKALLADVNKGTRFCGYFIADVMWQLAKGFHYMHTQAKVIHVDNHSPNFMFTHEGVAKIIDFGLSEAMKDGNTSYLFADESWPWFPASPERARRQPFGSADDMYALGYSMVGLTTPNAPFVGRNNDLVIDTLDYDGTVQLMGSLIPELGAMAAKLLHEDAKQRPTALEAVAMFERVKMELDPRECCETRFACDGRR